MNLSQIATLIMCSIFELVHSTPCKDGYSELQNVTGKYYKLYPGQKSYFDARDYCINDGTQLAMPKTEKEALAIQAIASEV